VAATAAAAAEAEAAAAKVAFEKVRLHTSGIPAVSEILQ